MSRVNKFLLVNIFSDCSHPLIYISLPLFSLSSQSPTIRHRLSGKRPDTIHTIMLSIEVWIGDAKHLTFFSTKTGGVHSATVNHVRDYGATDETLLDLSPH